MTFSPLTTNALESEPALTPAESPVARFAAPARPAVWPAAWSLARRELIRFLRQRNRVIGALLTPVVFWLLLGLGMGDAFQAPGTGESFLSYFFPGMLLMVLLFTAIFANITIIEDRREGFMQGVLVAPVPRVAVVLGKAIGGTILAAGQAILLLILAPLAVGFDPIGYLVAVGFLVVTGFGLTCLGFCLAWPLTSTAGFHVLMNLLLMPLWFLSGAVFPLGAAKLSAVQWVTYANPLSWGLAGIRHGLHWGAASPTPGLPPVWACGVVSVVFAIAMLGLASFVAERRTRADVES